ncbi:MAG: right-handed parallel beta-helix repeat-containing protein [Deinococcus sp.]|nr:right-handed parallel beta-helix repeat-containing protein [Deinococcus sp.]
MKTSLARLWLFPLWAVWLSACGVTLAQAQTYYVAPNGSDAAPGTALQPWATLQHAADQVNPGDTVIVRPGQYTGMRVRRSGTAMAPITFRGEPGASVDRPGPANSNGDNIWIRNAHYIVIEGFEVTAAPRAGIAVQGEPDDPATGVVIRQNFSHHNARWGIFTGYAQDLVVEGNETAFSQSEHGIYVSNSADNPIIRRNQTHHNRSAGIQINADPALEGDGIITNALVEENIIYENGAGGAAGINLASVRASVIRNNLLYDNHATGIAGWDDEAGLEFGTKGNRIVHNTIVQAANGRFAIVLVHGSTDNVILNNILFHPGSRGSIETDSDSLSGLVSDYNVVVNRFSLDEEFITLADWRAQGFDQHSLMAPLAALVVSPGQADYHLAPNSPAVDAGTVVLDVTTDLEGRQRPQGAGYDIGAYESPKGTAAIH